MLHDTPIINEYSFQESLGPREMDAAWANGWRHFGAYFFRYSRTGMDETAQHVLPLRIKLDEFEPSKSQKRVIAKNRDLAAVVRDTFIDEQKLAMFERHKTRFKEHVPKELSNFLGDEPATVPCETKEICLYDGGRLVAVSFWDIGETATSSIYAMFEPDESKRSLGIYLILLSIQFSLETGKKFYYPGYTYLEKSFYDYKKRFSALYYFNWHGEWLPLGPET